MIPVVGRQYKIVKSLYEHGHIEWIEPMDEYVGRICTVVYVSSGGHGKWVRIDIDQKTWCWDFNSLIEEDFFSNKDFEL